MSKKVYIVAAKRTPQARAGTELREVPAPYLATPVVRSLLNLTGLPLGAIEEVIFGNTGAPAKYPNISRVVALEAGLPQEVSAHTVHRNCASGLEAVGQGFTKIASGRNHLLVVGGVESMTQMPFAYGPEMVNFFVGLSRAKTLRQKFKVLKGFRLHHLKPRISIEEGLRDPFCGLMMGETAEVLAREFGISRQEQDEYALNSHEKAIKAVDGGRFDEELVAVVTGKNADHILAQDSGPRRGSTLKKLARMKPYFEKGTGTVTVANSCPLTDGAAGLILASEEAVQKYGLKPIAIIRDYHFHGLEPERMGLGPVVSSYHLLKRLEMTLEDIDLVEINEAFAAQVLGCLHLINDHQALEARGLSAFGKLDPAKLNVNGGAIALGHPVGATGARLLVTLVHELKKREARRGLATLCIGGGMGGACVVESLSEGEAI